MATPSQGEARVVQWTAAAGPRSEGDLLELLLDAGRALDPADLAGSLRNLARICAGRLGEICVIDVIAGGTPAPLALAHADARREPEAQELRRRYPPQPDDHAGVTEVARSGRAEIVGEIGARAPESLRAFRELGMGSAMVAPIRSRRRIVGVITVMALGERRYEAADLRALEDVAARIGLAAAAAGSRDGRPPLGEPERERLFALEKAARAAAEVAVHRIAALQSVTAALSEAVTFAQVADIIVSESVESLGARAVTLHLFDTPREALELTASRALPAEGIEALAQIPLNGGSALVRAALSGEPSWIEGADRAPDAVPSALCAGGVPVAFAAVPLMVGGGVVGVLGLAFDEHHVFSEEERVFALALVRHCAQVIDRARLFEAERRTNQRLYTLAKASEQLSSSIDYETTLDNVARCALPALGDYGFFDVMEEGSPRRVARSAAGSDLGALAPASCKAEDLRALGLRSVISVPLAARGTTLGTLALAFGPSGRRHTADDVETLREIARLASIAVENAALHAASRDAMRRAQEANRRGELANRAKDEFLGVVSHELRTPLNAVLGWAQLLRGGSSSDPAVLAKGLGVIDRNARAQAKLIEDLLDVSRIITGKLRLDPRPIDIEGVVRAALDVIRPAADAKGIEIAWTSERGATVSGDPDRLQQVVWNLVSNAVKFTPEGGKVTVVSSKARGAGTSSVVISVRDSGRGIEREVLPHVFERFWQADSSPTRRHGGLGLGLAIVRHLVELHGGSVRADSEGLGHGATFTVTLPARDEQAWAEITGPGRGSSDPGRMPLRLDGLRVLVVDDERDARELVATLLDSAGASVSTAGSAAEAMDALSRSQMDVLVSDIAMPGEDGYALIRMVRASEALCRLPALALTAYAGAEDARKAVVAGFHTHLPKPAEPAMLTAVVASLCGRMGA